MTLSTDIYVQSPGLDPTKAFQFVATLLEADETYKFETTSRHIMALPGQGYEAWLSVYFAPGGAQIVPSAAEVEEMGKYVSPAHYVRINLDSGYSARTPAGGGVEDLHAYFLMKIGEWLSEQQLNWTWRNEFTGEYNSRFEGIADFGNAEIGVPEKRAKPVFRSLDYRLNHGTGHQLTQTEREMEIESLFQSLKGPA